MWIVAHRYGSLAPVRAELRLLNSACKFFRKVIAAAVNSSREYRTRLKTTLANLELMTCCNNFKAFSFARSMRWRGLCGGVCDSRTSPVVYQMFCRRCLVFANTNVNVRAALCAQIMIHAKRMLGCLAPGRILLIRVIVVSAAEQVEVNVATEQVEGGDCLLNLRGQFLVFLGESL